MPESFEKSLCYITAIKVKRSRFSFFDVCSDDSNSVRDVEGDIEVDSVQIVAVVGGPADERDTDCRGRMFK